MASDGKVLCLLLNILIFVDFDLFRTKNPEIHIKLISCFHYIKTAKFWYLFYFTLINRS